MSNERRRHIVPSDVDAQGNVTIWDHGPQEPKQAKGESEEDFKVRQETYKGDLEEWNEQHDAPVPILRHRVDAAGAVLGDERYALEPAELDEGAIEAEVKRIQEERAARLAAPQNAADRKTAIANLMGARSAEARVEKAKPTEQSALLFGGPVKSEETVR